MSATLTRPRSSRRRTPSILKQRVRIAAAHRHEPRPRHACELRGREAAHRSHGRVVADHERGDEHPRLVEEILREEPPHDAAARLDQHRRNAVPRERRERFTQRPAGPKHPDRRAARSKRRHARLAAQIEVAAHEDLRGRVLREDARLGRSHGVGVEDEPSRHALDAHAARREQGVVREDGSDPRQDRVDPRTRTVHHASASSAAQPPALARCKRDGAIDRLRPLRGDPRQACSHAVDEGKRQLSSERVRTVLREDSARAKSRRTSRRARVRVAHGEVDPRDARIRERLGAWPRAAVVCARLERHDGRRPARACACGGKRVHLRVRPAAAPMEARREDAASFADDHAADHRVWLRAAEPARGCAHGAAIERVELQGRHARAPTTSGRDTGSSSPVTLETDRRRRNAISAIRRSSSGIPAS